MNIARRRFHGAALLSLLIIPAAACQRVPLLAPSGSTITLSSLNTALPLNGATQLVATVLESGGTPPHSGTHIIFTTTLGSIEPSEATTDINGRAVATFRAGTASGTATITASSGGANVGANGGIKIAVGTAAISAIFVTASPTTLSANGGTATISALVRDVNGNALPGVPISFSTNAGTLSTAIATSDSSGVASVTLTTTRTATVTATAGSVAAPPSGGGTGGGGGTATPTNVTNQVTVNVNVGPSISLGAPTPATPTVGQLVGFPITIAAPGTTGSPLRSLVVEFGDGGRQTFSPGSSTTITAQHVYNAPGTYTVTAEATDTNGDTSHAQTAVAILPRAAPTVTISANANPAVGQPVIFTINATAPTGTTIASIKVDFGDGDSVTLSGNATNVQHLYQNSGTYVVSATATDSAGGVGSASTVIVVGGAATANFTFTAGPAATHTVNFDASSSSSPAGNITNYAWNFGDNSTGNGVSVSHNYGSANTFTVVLTVTDSAGRTATVSKQVTAP